MNNFLKAIEKEGVMYNTGKTANVHFENGEAVKPRQEAKYLGCHLNREGDHLKEVKQRISSCTTTLKQLDTFWRHSDCPTRQKITVQDAVIRTKLLYGLESAELKQAELDKIDVFQLKGLRKILRMETTYAQTVQGQARTNTNEAVLKRANTACRKHQQASEAQTNEKKIILHSQVHKENIAKLLHKVLNARDDPYATVHFNLKLSDLRYNRKKKRKTKEHLRKNNKNGALGQHQRAPRSTFSSTGMGRDSKTKEGFMRGKRQNEGQEAEILRTLQRANET
jgi:hypothetical protein